MNSSANFFLPWQNGFVKAKDYRTVCGKNQHNYKEDSYKFIKTENINWWSKPYFAILNEKSTVKFFLDALMVKPDEQEAKVYLSRYFEQDDLFEQAQILFKHVCHYKYALELNKRKNAAETTTITIVPKYSEAASHYPKLIHVQMVLEPNRYGVWKICKIEGDNGDHS